MVVVHCNVAYVIDVVVDGRYGVQEDQVRGVFVYV